MTSIKDLELRIKSAASTLEMLRGELEELRQQEQQEPEQESLLGRWATHPTFGRGIVIYEKPYPEDRVRLAHRVKPEEEEVEGETAWPLVHLTDLTLDPVTLTTAKDFNDAPEGTIAEIMVEPKGVYVKKDNVWFGAGEEYPTPVQSLTKARVIRWGSSK